jgi:hypothetical protein
MRGASDEAAQRDDSREWPRTNMTTCSIDELDLTRTLQGLEELNQRYSHYMVSKRVKGVVILWSSRRVGLCLTAPKNGVRAVGGKRTTRYA